MVNNNLQKMYNQCDICQNFEKLEKLKECTMCRNTNEIKSCKSRRIYCCEICMDKFGNEICSQCKLLCPIRYNSGEARIIERQKQFLRSHKGWYGMSKDHFYNVRRPNLEKIPPIIIERITVIGDLRICSGSRGIAYSN